MVIPSDRAGLSVHSYARVERVKWRSVGGVRILGYGLMVCAVAAALKEAGEWRVRFGYDLLDEAMVVRAVVLATGVGLVVASHWMKRGSRVAVWGAIGVLAMYVLGLGRWVVMAVLAVVREEDWGDGLFGLVFLLLIQAAFVAVLSQVCLMAKAGAGHLNKP